jgi:hypothetical protein
VIRHLIVVPFLAFALVAVAQIQHKAAPSKPVADAQLYRNAAFGFRYEIPFGWVDRTKDMQQQGESKADPKNASGKAEASASEVLLAVFERPPDAAGETVNSAVVIATESAASYPGLKRAEDYLGPLTELATSKGFKAEGDPSVVEIDGHELVRADFSKPLNSKLTMRQTTLVLLAKHRIVSFTFIAGTEDEVDDLIDGLHFAIGR